MTRSIPSSDAGRPNDESERLAFVRASSLLDAASDSRFDDLTRLAAVVFRIPIALLSVIDGERIFFKSRHGLNVSEAPFSNSFCGLTYARRRVTTIRDARADPRFAEHPLVRDEPRLRFYAGAPIFVGNGHVVGTICIMDRVPCELDGEQELALHLMARQAAAILEMDRKLQSFETALRGGVAAPKLSADERHLAVCAWCKRVRVEDGLWSEIESYLERRFLAAVSHGICPKCEASHFGRTPNDSGAA